MSDRYFNNPFSDCMDADEKVVDVDSKKIHPEFCEKIKPCTTKLLEKLERHLHEVNPKDYSVYTGTSGIALLYLLLSERCHPCYLEKATALIEVNLKKLKGRDYSFICGDAGPLALGTVLYHKNKQNDKAEQCLKKLLSLLPKTMDCDLPDELLYGRVGYLYSLLFVKSHMANAIPDDAIKQVINAVIASGTNLSQKLGKSSPLFYEWYEEYYLGGAHGFAGIIYLLLLAKDYLTEEQLKVIRQTIDYLLTKRYPSGNFPSSLGSSSDCLVHWCHGAPGFVQMLCLAYKVYGDAKYWEAAEGCGEVVWSRGLLKKGYGICHGVAGNAYTFLTLFQSSNDVKHLYRACKFAEWCSTYNKYQERTPDRPYSLFEGLAGTVYFMFDFQKPHDAKFPAYTV